MTSILYRYYKDNCGAYNNIFIDMKRSYYFIKISPIVLFLLSIVLSGLFRNIFYLVGGGVFIIILSFIALKIVHKSAKKIVLQKKIVDNEYVGPWNNAEVLEKLNQKDKIKLAVFLEEKKKKKKKYLEKIINEVDILIELNKPKFPVIPTVFGGLVVAWYSAFTSWLFKITTDINMMQVPVIISLVVLLLFIICYISYKMIIEAINEMFFGEEYDKLNKFRNLLDELLFDLEDK